jgi:hypothetical protein
METKDKPKESIFFKIFKVISTLITIWVIYVFGSGFFKGASGSKENYACKDKNKAILSWRENCLSAVALGFGASVPYEQKKQWCSCVENIIDIQKLGNESCWVHQDHARKMWDADSVKVKCGRPDNPI